MGLLQKIRKLLGLVEGHEDEVAKQVSKRTSVSESQAREGIDQVREAVEDRTDGSDGRSGE